MCKDDACDDLFMRVSEDDICRGGLDSWPKVTGELLTGLTKISEEASGAEESCAPPMHSHINLC